MSILSRKKGETVHIGDNVTVTVLESRGNRVGSVLTPRRA